MINLLPPEIKQSYRYGQLNSGLRHWLIAAFCGLIGLGLIGAYGALAMHQAIASTDQQIASTDASLAKAHLSDTKKQTTDITNSLKLVEKVLGQEILFSKLLKQMATALPAGSNLTALNIAQVSGGSGLDVTANATNYTTATQVQVNLADPRNQIFAKADIVSINCDNTTSKNPAYPCTVNIRAQFAQNNPFLFINQKAAKS